MNNHEDVNELDVIGYPIYTICLWVLSPEVRLLTTNSRNCGEIHR